MYLPTQFTENDVRSLQRLIGQYPLGTWIISSGAELVVNHIPFLLKDTQDGKYILQAHVAKANPVWRLLDQESPSLVTFQGPQAYITPSWYQSKQEHGRVVPTWNYTVVHAHGTAGAIQDRNWLEQHVSCLTDTHEAMQEKPWKVTDAPSNFIQAQLNGIVGIEIPISKIEGKWKVSQNRSEEDRAGVVRGLCQQQGGASELADIMKANLT